MQRVNSPPLESDPAITLSWQQFDEDASAEELAVKGIPAPAEAVGAVIYPGGIRESEGWLTKENPAGLEPAMGIPAQQKDKAAPFCRLHPDEEKECSTIIQGEFQAICRVIDENRNGGAELAGLLARISGWLQHSDPPVPKKKRLNLIRRRLGRSLVENPDSASLITLRTAVIPRIERIEKAAERMVLGNLGLVPYFAWKFKDRGISHEDLVQEGCLGLMKASYRFDYRKAKFCTYASWWIRQAMGRIISEMARTIKLPSNLSEQRARFFRVFFSMKKTLQRTPDIIEAAEKARVPLDKVKMILASEKAVSLDTTIGDDNKNTLGDIIADPCSPSVVEQVERRSLSQRMRNVLDELLPRESEVLRMRYGIDGNTPHTLEEISRKFDLSRERVRQIESKALSRLRHPVRRHKLYSFI